MSLVVLCPASPLVAYYSTDLGQRIEEILLSPDIQINAVLIHSFGSVLDTRIL